MAWPETNESGTAPPAGERRWRIVHVVLNLDEGGLETIVGELVRRLDPADFELHIVALEFLGRCAAGLEEFAELHVLDDLEPWSLLWSRSFTDKIRSLAPDVIHSHSGVWLKAARAARRAGVPCLIHTDHGRKSPDPWRDRLVDGWASAHTAVVVAVSEVLGEQLRQTVIRGSPGVQVITNGVDTEHFHPLYSGGDLRAELGIPENTPVLGSIGRLDAIKAYEVMVNALALIRSRWSEADRPPPILVLTGDGPERERLIGLANNLEIGEAVRFLGWRSDIRSVHQALTLFTLSSRSEGTSVALLEAMSSGLCPVVTAVGGNPAVLGEDLSHRLCAPGSPEALANAWLDVLRDSRRSREDAALARQIVEQRFSLRAMVQGYADLYRSVIGQVPPIRRSIGGGNNPRLG